MNKATLMSEITNCGFFCFDEPDFEVIQPYTSGVGRIHLAEKRRGEKISGGLSFYIQEVDGHWFLGLYSPEWFLAKDPEALKQLALDFLSRRRHITSRTGLAPDIIRDFHLEDWTDTIGELSWQHIIICKDRSFSTLDEARMGHPKMEAITKEQFVNGLSRHVDRYYELTFNGIGFEREGVKGIIRFVDNRTCLEFHEILLQSEATQVGSLSDKETSLVTTLCDALDCAAFTPKGMRIRGEAGAA